LIAGGVGKATIGGASPRADAEPSIGAERHQGPRPVCLLSRARMAVRDRRIEDADGRTDRGSVGRAFSDDLESAAGAAGDALTRFRL